MSAPIIGTSTRSTRTTPSTIGSGALAPGEHTVSIGGLEQRYHVAGRGPVCLVHPGGPGVGWEYLRMPAVEPYVTAVYLEPIGTGGSSRLIDPRQYTLHRYVESVHGLVEQLGVEDVFFLGHSHGGFVGQCYALAHQERLAGLILYDTSPTTAPDFWTDVGQNLRRFAERHAGRPEEVEMPGILSAFEDAGRATGDEELTAILRRLFPAYFADYWGREREWAPLRGAVRMYAGPLQGEEPAPFDVRGELASITVPTLVIVGRHDPICAPRWAHLLHDRIPGSRLLILEDSGHFGHIEEAEVFARAVADLVHAHAAD
ncbi:MAG: alpha/beta fold hydrolase [Chloroflexota bacterium]